MAPNERLIGAGIVAGTAYLVWMVFSSRFSAEPDHVETSVVTPLTNLAVDLTGFTLGAIAPVVGQMTRGLRNNNPGNIRDTSETWVGEIGADDAGYIKFDTMAHGVRAMTIVLRNYRARYGLKTVRGIVNRWAPRGENDTDAYVRDVANRLGVNPDYEINIDFYMPKLIEALIIHENGYNPLSLAEINQGIALA